MSIPTTPIAPSSTRSGSFPVSGLASGTLYLVVNGEGTIPEVTLSNNVSTGFGW